MVSSSDSKNVIVTGGAGFIGSRLVRTLVSSGHDITVIDNLESGHRESIPQGVKFIRADISNNIAEQLPASCDAVFHLAAQTEVQTSVEAPDVDAETNIIGTVNVLQAVQNLQPEQFIFFSTGGAVYDEGAELPHTETSPVAPQSPYGLSKYTAENYIQLLLKNSGITTTILRPSNVYGARPGSQTGGVISIFAQRLAVGDKLVIYGDGEQTRDFIHVDDVVAAAHCVLRNDLGGVYNVSTGNETSINQVVDTIAAVSDQAVSTEFRKARPGEVKRSVLSAGRLYEKIGWSAETSLQKGIKNTLDNYKNES